MTVRTVKTAGLKAGMRVTEPIVGKNGDVKVRSGEILSQSHVDKLNKWKGVDAANPRGIHVETALGSGTELPDVVDRPELSPLIQQKSKNKLQSSMQVPVEIRDGKVIRDDEEQVQETADANTGAENNIARRRGRKPAK